MENEILLNEHTLSDLIIENEDAYEYAENMFNSQNQTIMDFNSYFESFETAYDEAVSKIIELRETAEEIRSKMDDIIDSCETIEGEL